MEVAFAQEVLPGEAELWATISGETARPYRVVIEKVSDADSCRNMVVRVVDPELLSATGGICAGDERQSPGAKWTLGGGCDPCSGQ